MQVKASAVPRTLAKSRMPTTPVLTEASFPHIIDNILSFSSWTTWVSVRSTCRRLKARVVLLQCRSLVLVWEDAGPHSLNVRAIRSSKDNPSLSHNPLAVYDGESSAIYHTIMRIPGLRTICPLSWSLLPVHPGLRLTSNTRVLQIAGPVPVPCDLSLLASAFPHLELLRLTAPFDTGTLSYVPVVAPVIAVFCNKTPQTVQAHGAQCPAAAKRTFPEGCETVIINMKGMNSHVLEIIPDLSASSIRRVIFTVPCYTRIDLGGVVDEGFEPPQTIFRLVELITTAPLHIQFLIVGVEHIATTFLRTFFNSIHVVVGHEISFRPQPGMHLTFTNVAPNTDAVQAVLAHEGVEIPSSKQGAITQVLERIRLCTSAEYMAEVGEERFELETVEYL